LIAILIVMLRWFERSQTYHPSRTLRPVDASLRGRFQDVSFKTTDGVELNGWFFAADKDSARSNLVFLLCHGNGGNISHRAGECQTLLETGVNVFIFDYRGYGRSQGKPDEEGTYLDAQAAHVWLEQKGFEATNIIAYGESLGGGIAAELALREKVAGLVLQSTFTSIPDIGAEIYPWLPVRLISTIKYDTRSKLPQIHVPVLIMHSRNDGLVNYLHAERNFAAANSPKFLQELDGSHNDAVWEQVNFLEAIETFLTLIETSRKPPT
jgi:uncharacterized protein